MIVARKARVSLFEHEYVRGEVVPVAVWNRLPKYRQHVLLGAGQFEQTEVDAGSAPVAEKKAAKRKRGRPKGSKNKNRAKARAT